MELSVAEVAQQRGVSSRRVLQLIAGGDIFARRVGGRWLIEERETNKRPRLSRPMSHRMAWALINLMSGQKPEDLDPTEYSRLRRRLGELVERARIGEEIAAGLSSLLRARGHVVFLRVQPESLRDLREDSRLVLSGISDPRSGMSAGDEVEAYVRPADFDSVVSDWFLIERTASSPNVLLHVADFTFAEAPLGLVIADLADHARPREDGEAERLLASVEL